MADFSALKTSIQNYIKQNGNNEITGAILQQILLSMVTALGDNAINDLVAALGDEVAARQNADGTLQDNIGNEATARSQADGTLQQNINNEASTREQADNALGARITAEEEARIGADNTLRNSINSIIADIEHGYVYAGIAIPSTTPATGKVFYLALTAGTYTNFDSTVVPQGINILKYNGSAWVLDSFLGLDNVPTQGSNNFVKSGGVLDSIIKDGSAFDLSAYNSGATYAGLSAALSALNALPAAYKRGGMSIKFVQTSDNKYVQWRLMANSFTTDESYWQGIDEEPIQGSNNLVKSGGIALQTGELFGITINGTGNYVKDKIYAYDGITLNNTEGYNSFIKYLPVKNGDIIKWNYGKVGGSGCYLLIYDSEYNKITNYSGTGGDANHIRTISINNASWKYIRFSYNALTVSDTANTTPVLVNDVCPYTLKEYEDSLNTRLEKVEGYNDFISKDNFIKGALAADGKINIGVEGYRVTEKIPVAANDSINWKYGNTQINNLYLCVYNSSDEMVGGAWNSSGGSNGIRKSILMPANASYLRATFADNVEGLIIEKNLQDAYIVTENGAFYNLVEQTNENTANINSINKTIDGIGNTIQNKTIGYNDKVEENENWNYIFTSVKNNDTIVYNIGKLASSSFGLNLYDESGNLLNSWAATNKTTDDSRTIQITGYPLAHHIKANFCKYLTNDTANTTPLVINGNSIVSVDYENGILADIEELENKMNKVYYEPNNEYGFIGKYFPEEIDDITKVLGPTTAFSTSFQNRFNFLHISDNHGASFNHAGEFLDLCPAKFLVVTGDLVADKYSDDATTLLSEATSPTKPVYLVLGNHDYAGAPSQQAVFDKFIAPTNTHNGTSFTTTYYSLDDNTNHVKCIFLDMNDGWGDYTDLGPSVLASGCKMSATQINWFYNQLVDAKTNNMHVCCFIHLAPDVIDFHNLEWGFYNYESVCHFLADMVDKFMDGGQLTFTHNGTEFTFSFEAGGHFVAWFSGHLHDDACGWMKDHPNQYSISVIRSGRSNSSGGTMYDAETYDVHYNYYTIDTNIKVLSVYRVGNQKTIFATERKSFRLRYK